MYANLPLEQITSSFPGWKYGCNGTISFPGGVCCLGFFRRLLLLGAGAGAGDAAAAAMGLDAASSGCCIESFLVVDGSIMVAVIGSMLWIDGAIAVADCSVSPVLTCLAGDALILL